MPRIPKLPAKSLAVHIGMKRGTSLKAMEDELDAQDNRQVRCFACGQKQRDEGPGATCCRCGCSPLPSYSYPVSSAFRPHPPRESQQKRIERLVRERQG
jgi:hypothetical protein